MHERRALRILQVSGVASAGVGRHVLDLSEGLVARGHHVHLFCSIARAEPAFQARLETLRLASVEQFPVPREIGRADLAAIRALRRFAAECGPYDIVHGHASKAGAWVRLATTGSKAVYTPNALITQDPALPAHERILYQTVERCLARRTDLTIHVSPEEAEHADKVGLRPRRRAIIPNGIPLGRAPDRREAREALDLDLAGDEVLLGFVGRLEHQKGVALLLEVMARLARRRGRVHLAIVGDGSMRGELETASAALGLQHVVHFLGHRPGVEAIAAFDAFLLGSHYEGFPYVLIEALLCNVPFVATEGSCARQLLDLSPSSRIVPRAVDAFVDAVTELLSGPVVAVDRDALERSFGVSAMVQRVENAYLALIGRR